MHGREFDNATNALIDLHSELAMPTRGATGSKDGTAGNAASDIIGQYRIYAHIYFGNKTLSDITGSYERVWGNSSKPRKSSIRISLSKSNVKIDNRPAKEGLYAKFGTEKAWEIIKQLRDKFGDKLINDEFNGKGKFTGLTYNEAELRFGLDKIEA